MTARKPSRDAPESYRIVVSQGADGWWVAKAPKLPGAISQGRTEAQAILNLERGIEDLLETYSRQGRSLR